MEGKVTFFASFYETLKKLQSAEDRERFAMGLLGYAFEGLEPDFSDNLALDLAFTNARPNLDASAKKARVARENGEAGGRPETDAKTNRKTNAKTDAKTNRKTNARTQPLQEKERDKEKDRDKEKEGEVSFSLEKTKPSPASNGADGGQMAAPPSDYSPYVSPYCSKCGSPSPPTIGGFMCPTHGKRTREEVLFL